MDDEAKLALDFLKNSEEHKVKEFAIAQRGNGGDFVLFFRSVSSENPGKGAVNQSFALRPALMKQLVKLLGDSVAEHEQEFGPIARRGEQSPIQQSDMKGEEN